MRLVVCIKNNLNTLKMNGNNNDGKSVKINISLKEAIQYLVMIIGFVSIFFIMRAQVDANTQEIIEAKDDIRYLKNCIINSQTDFATIKADVRNIQTDVRDLKQDVKKLLERK